MSRTIDPETPVEDLTDDELQYLYARDKVSAEVMIARGLPAYGDEDASRASMMALQDVPNFGDANTKGLTGEDLVPAENYEKALKPLKENLTKPQLVGQDDDDDDEVVDVPEDTDYENWNNDQRRAELADRELSVEGKKDELIARLKADDASKG